MNIFEQASRLKLRFPSVRGELTTEQLWDMPLTSRNDFNLDRVARTVNAEIKSMDEESFVSTNSNPAKRLAELRLEIVKFVISDRQEANAKSLMAASRAEERQRLLAALAKKDEQALNEMSADDIKKRLAELGE